MFGNYFFIALQGLKKHPVFSAVKILSLAIGLGCSILVLMHVQYAKSFDKHFPNWENTYRLTASFVTDQTMNTESTPDPWGPQLKLDYPQIEHIAKIRRNDALMSRDGRNATNETFYWAEPDIIKIFSLEFVSGDPETALDDPYSIILNESMAQKYFPGEEALGQTLTAEGQIDVNVTGVFRDLPENTHLNFEIFASVSTGRQLFGENFMQNNFWFLFQGTRTYLTLPNKQEAEFLANELGDFLDRNMPEDTRTGATNARLTAHLENIGDIYLSEFIGFGGTNSRPKVILGLAIFASLILITSCINFANLSLSQIQQRGKEIGVRKTLGANRFEVVKQFLFESLLLTFLALLIAIPFVLLLIPVYTNLTNTGFTFISAMQTDMVIYLLVFVIAVGLLSGLIPALLLSKFDPAAIISGVINRGRFSRIARPAVTVVQFGFSTSLIILAIAISLQINYLNSMDIGFNKNDLMVLNAELDPLGNNQFNYTAMLDEIRQGPGIVSVANAAARPPNVGALNPWRIPSFPPDERRAVRHFPVNENYIETMQMKLLAGRGFSLDFPSDFETPPQPGTPPPPPEERPIRGAVIAERQVANFGFESPEAAIGEILDLFGNRFRVIGVVENFRFSGGMEDALQSTGILRGTLQPLPNILIRIDPLQSQQAIAHIDEVWNRHRPDVPVDRIFYEQIYNDLLTAQTEGISKAAIFASIITVLISAFGLYALAFYSSERRTKEVGVRKVLGATSKTIIPLLTWDFVKPVLIACVLAWGVGYYAITLYFQEFSSRTEISPLLYIVVTLGTIAVAIVTVATQCFKAAKSDPVISLRYE